MNMQAKKIQIIWALTLLIILGISTSVVVTQSWRCYRVKERNIFEASRKSFQNSLSPLINSILEDLNNALESKIPAKVEGENWVVTLPDEQIAVYELDLDNDLVLRKIFKDRKLQKVNTLVKNIKLFQMKDRGKSWWNLYLKGKVTLANGQVKYLLFDYDFKPPSKR
jgi:hypothetical protein